MTAGPARERERRGDDDAAGERDPERQQAAPPVGEAPQERRDHHLDRRGADEGRGDRGGAPARVARARAGRARR